MVQQKALINSKIIAVLSVMLISSLSINFFLVYFKFNDSVPNVPIESVTISLTENGASAGFVNLTKAEKTNVNFAIDNAIRNKLLRAKIYCKDIADLTSRFSVNNAENWIMCDDGYFYYLETLTGSETIEFININNLDAYSITENMQLEIVAETISNNQDIVEKVWQNAPKNLLINCCI